MKTYIITRGNEFYQGGMWTDERFMAMEFTDLENCKRFVGLIEKRFPGLKIEEV